MFWNINFKISAQICVFTTRKFFYTNLLMNFNLLMNDYKIFKVFEVSQATITDYKSVYF
jgi:hypothetical protein